MDLLRDAFGNGPIGRSLEKARTEMHQQINRMTADQLDGEDLNEAVEDARRAPVLINIADAVFQWGPDGPGVRLRITLPWAGDNLAIICTDEPNASVWKYDDRPRQLVATTYLAPPPPHTEAEAWRDGTMELLTKRTDKNNVAIEQHNEQVGHEAVEAAAARRRHLEGLGGYEAAFGKPSL